MPIEVKIVSTRRTLIDVQVILPRWQEYLLIEGDKDDVRFYEEAAPTSG